MRTFSITDVGMVRQVNQDYVYTIRWALCRICLWWRMGWEAIRPEITPQSIRLRC